MKNARLLGIRAESYVHVGVGQAFGDVDLPVVREAATGFPVIPGSALKGSLRRAHWRHLGGETGEDGAAKIYDDEKMLFGTTDAAAGGLIIGDAQIVFLPMRCLGEAFVLLTCPLLLNRACRSFKRTGKEFPFNLAGDLQALTGHEADKDALYGQGSQLLMIEELPFDGSAVGAIPSCMAKQMPEFIKALLPEADAHEAQTLASRVAIVQDEIFSYFTRFALPVRTRNSLDEVTKIVKDGFLWSEEYVPPESILMAVIADRDWSDEATDPLGKLASLINDGLKGFLQIGGNETVGQGIVSMRLAGS